MSDLLRVLQEPLLVEAMNHLTTSLDLHALLQNIGTGIQEKVGSEMAGAFIERIVRWGKSRLSAESDETIDTSMKRAGILYDGLADEIVNLRTSGVSVGAATFRTAYNDPQGAAALTAACNAASETDDIKTIRALAHRETSAGRIWVHTRASRAAGPQVGEDAPIRVGLWACAPGRI